MNVLDFREMKTAGRKISMITCYDFWSAQILAQSNLDCILVGDSLAMIMHGFKNTIPATPELIGLHLRAVAAGAPEKFLVADMPFLSVRKSLPIAMDAVDIFMKAGAQAVKIEGVEGHEEVIRHIVQSGVPVMGHLGLKPQSIHQVGGYRVHGRGDSEAESLYRQAERIQELGCFAVVLECMQSETAAGISRQLDIPTIGIGAGSGTDGQVLVLHDMLDLFPNVQPKFVRKYGHLYPLILDAVNQYVQDVKNGDFPSEQEAYS